MTDSPFFKAPLDLKEKPILDRLLSIRDQLLLLKQDKSTYVKSQDVVTLYDQLMEQVELLNQIREQKRDEQNRVDYILDDCFQLLSLFFMTIGRNNEVPALYSAVSTVKRLLDHLKEAAFFLPQDLITMHQKLDEWSDAIKRGEAVHSPHLLTLLEARIDVCRTTLAELELALSKLTPETSPIYEKLVTILRKLSSCVTRSKFPIDEVRDYRKELLNIQARLHEPDMPHDERPAEQRFEAKIRQLSITPGATPEEGRQLCVNLLQRCLIWSEILEDRQGAFNPNFRELYDKLRSIRDKLERLSLTQAWSLRETDLYSFQRQLDKIDESRVDGNFLDSEGQPACLLTQRMLLYLVRKSYATIYQLILASEPVSEALLPIYNQLLTLRRCLIEVKRSGGVDSPRELYPYSMKLNSIDNMRVDGKFMVNDDVPEGQGAVSTLLAECFDMAYELRVAAEHDGESAEKKDVVHNGVSSNERAVLGVRSPDSTATDDTISPTTVAH